MLRRPRATRTLSSRPEESEPLADEKVTYPGARLPDRRRWVDAYGVQISVSEWGDPDAPGVLLVHGGFDFAGTFAVFGPILADAGWRAVSWDHRGHGDS